MTPSSAAFLALPVLFTAHVAAAQSLEFTTGPSENRWKIPVEAQPKVARRGIRIPIVSYTAPDGSLKLKRGIIAGTRIAPNANIGLGLFETLPKRKLDNSSIDNPMKRKQRRSRKAAIGLSLEF